jgi:hypothetical protein
LANLAAPRHAGGKLPIGRNKVTPLRA